jgi:hypothetical protein
MQAKQEADVVVQEEASETAPKIQIGTSLELPMLAKQGASAPATLVVDAAVQRRVSWVANDGANLEVVEEVRQEVNAAARQEADAAVLHQAMLLNVAQVVGTRVTRSRESWAGHQTSIRNLSTMIQSF